jgi:TolA-binding protein
MKKYIFVILIILIPGFTFGKSKVKDPEVLDSLKLKEGDEKINDEKAIKTEILISQSEDLALNQVQKLISKYRGMAVEADLQLRLAELYMRKARTDRFFELNRESEVAVSLAPTKIKSASSRSAIIKAVGIYDYIEKRFSQFDKIDEVIFNNAFARQQLNQDKEAEEKYWKVIKKYGYSELVPDCHLAIGEMSFKQRRFEHALDHFNAIKKYPNSRVYPYGLYKGAWSLYNLRKTELAMQGLESVVEYGKMVERENLDARLDLRKEALTDMTLYYSELYPASNAYKYFTKQAKKEEVGELLLTLSRIYDRHSLYENKDIVLRDYVKNNPTGSIVPTIYDQLVWNYENMKNRNEAIKQLKAFSELCSPRSQWSKTQNQAPEISKCLEQFRMSSIKLAQKWLQIWEKNNAFIEFAEASEQAFKLFLENNNDLIAEKARFSMAQMQFKRSKFRDSSLNFEKVSQLTKDSTLAHDASYGAILALEKVNDKLKWSDKDEQLLESLVKFYTTKFPKGSFALDVEFKLALIFYEKSKYEKAGPIFVKLGKLSDKSEKVIKSQDLYLDILNHKKDYINLQIFSKSLIATATDKVRAVKLQTIYEESYFLDVQSNESKGKLEEAIHKYNKFVEENPKSKLAEKAGWNAIQLYFQLSDYMSGAQASLNYAKMFPSNENTIPALLKAAHAYEQMANLEKANEVLLQLANLDKSNSEKWKTLAADFYFINGEYTKAEYLYNQIRINSSGKVNPHVIIQLERMQKNSGTSSHISLLKELIKENIQPQASMAQLYFVEKLYLEKNYTQAFGEAMKVLNMDKMSSQYAKSKARFIQAKILEEEFDRQSVKSQLDKFTVVLALKTEKLDKAQQAYQSAIRYGDTQVAIDSLVQLALLYNKFVNVLKTMPVPSGLPEADIASFKNEIEKLVIPMEEKSVDTMSEALNFSKKMKIRDGSISKIQQELNKLNLIPTHNLEDDLATPKMILPFHTKKVVGL